MLKPVRRINTETGQAPQPLLSLNEKELWLIAVKYCRNASICDGSDMCATAHLFFFGRGGGALALWLERWTPDQETRVRSSAGSVCCFLEQETFTSQKYW